MIVARVQENGGKHPLKREEFPSCDERTFDKGNTRSRDRAKMKKTWWKEKTNQKLSTNKKGGKDVEKCQ